MDPEGSFAKLLAHGGLPSGWRASPIRSMAHEGSWYPVWLLHEFIESLRGTPFERAVLRSPEHVDDACGDRAPCACVYRDLSRRGIRWRRTPLCALEEVLLPTWVAQRYPELLAKASPPSVLRWDVARRVGKELPAHALGLASDMIAANRSLRHIFAWKVPGKSAHDVGTILHRSRTFLRRTRKGSSA